MKGLVLTPVQHGVTSSPRTRQRLLPCESHHALVGSPILTESPVTFSTLTRLRTPSRTVASLLTRIPAYQTESRWIQEVTCTLDAAMECTFGMIKELCLANFSRVSQLRTWYLRVMDGCSSSPNARSTLRI